MDKKNIIICGIGAIGSIYAVAFSDCPYFNTKVLVDEKRLKRYLNEPIIFNNQKYDFEYITPTQNNIKADLIILATKNNNLCEVLPNLKNFVKSDTLILSLLNGLESESIISNYFDKNNVIDSYYIGHTSTRLDRKIIHDGIYKTVFGEKNNQTLSKRVETIKNIFIKANIPYEIPIDMEYSKWWKFLVNIGYNQASAIFNATYKDFQENQNINKFAINLMEETAKLAKAEGVNNTEKMIPEILEVIKNMLPETKTSMLQDIEAKRETEIDAFAGYLLKLAKKHSLDVPYNKVSYDIIKAIDSKLK